MLIVVGQAMTKHTAAMFHGVLFAFVAAMLDLV
jgi:hypothetical protein